MGTIPSGKTPSNATGNVCDELRVSMDDADKSSAPSIPGLGCPSHQSSCYGRCFARSGPPMIPAVLQSTSTGDRLPTTFRDTFIAEVHAFPFHLAGRYALYGPTTGFAREGGLQNCHRPSPDAALRLVRRKPGTSLPRPQSASDMCSDGVPA